MDASAAPLEQLESVESSSTKSKKPYKELNLEQKVDLIKIAQAYPRVSQAELARLFGIAKSNVCRIMKRKQEYILALESSNLSSARKRKLREGETTELNMLVASWVKERVKNGDLITGPLIQEKARAMASQFNLPNFVASNGWLQSFQKSYFNSGKVHKSASEKHNDEPSSTGNETLRAHMYRQHQISRMFMCRCCNWAFPDKTSLHIHTQSMATGSPGNVNIIAKTVSGGHSPDSPTTMVSSFSTSNGEQKRRQSEPTNFATSPPFLGQSGGIFPALPFNSELLKKLRTERAFPDGSPSFPNPFAWIGNFPQVDASGVGSLGGSLTLTNDETNNDENVEKDDEMPKTPPESAELIMDEDRNDSPIAEFDTEIAVESAAQPINKESDVGRSNENGGVTSNASISSGALAEALAANTGSSPLHSMLYRKKLLSSAFGNKTLTSPTKERQQPAFMNGILPKLPEGHKTPEHRRTPNGETVVSPSDTHSSSSNGDRQENCDYHSCGLCQLLKGKLALSENRNRFLEGKVVGLESKINRMESRLTALDANTRRYEHEGQSLRDQNENLQQKLLGCQEKILNFMQMGGGEGGEIQELLGKILQATYIG